MDSLRHSANKIERMATKDDEEEEEEEEDERKKSKCAFYFRVSMQSAGVS